MAEGFEVFLKYLPTSADEDGVKEFLGSCGEICGDVRLMRDSATGQCKGVAWVSFTTQAGADAAVKMSGNRFGGRNVQITRAKQVTWAGGHASTVGGIAGTIQAVGTHTPAMGHEVVAAVVGKDTDGVFVDGTFGRGGHSRLILKALGKTGSLHAFDLDPEAVKAGRELEKQDSRFKIHYGGFSSMAEKLPEAGVKLGSVSGVFLDLGISSPQLDEALRGFRPEQSGPLDLRFDLTKGQSASDFLRTAPRDEIVRVLKEYGDPSDPHAAVRVADAVCLARMPGGPGAPTTTRQFADLVTACRGYEYQAMHSAKAVFQALRIHLNDEFGELRGGMGAALELLQPMARLGVLTWKHSECALLVEFLRTKEVAPLQFPLYRWYQEEKDKEDFAGNQLKKKWGFVADAAQRPSAEELRINSRSRSAVLHILKKRQGLLCSDLEEEAASIFAWQNPTDQAERTPSAPSGQSRLNKKRKKSQQHEPEQDQEAEVGPANEEQEEVEAQVKEKKCKKASKQRKASKADEDGECAPEEAEPAVEKKGKKNKKLAEVTPDDEEAQDEETEKAPKKKARKVSQVDEVPAKPTKKCSHKSSSIIDLFEDEDVLAISKPAGLLCHPSPGFWDHGTVVHELEGRLPAKMLKHRESYTGEADSFIPRAVVHRLDRGTTGVLLLAKTPAAEDGLTAQFKGRSMKKRYVAILLGHPGGEDRAETISVNEPIASDPSRPGKVMISESGKVAKSIIHVHAYDEASDLSLVSVQLLTGRQHQIRIHCKHQGAPIANDDDYAGAAELAKFRKKFKVESTGGKRPLLHCWKMELTHPVNSDEPLTVKAPLPPDIQSLVARLWPDLPEDPENWPCVTKYRILLRGLPYTAEAQSIADFLKPAVSVPAESVRVPKKNTKRKYWTDATLRAGEAEAFVELSNEEAELVRKLSGQKMGSRWIEVILELDSRTNTDG